MAKGACALDCDSPHQLRKGGYIGAYTVQPPHSLISCLTLDNFPISIHHVPCPTFFYLTPIGRVRNRSVRESPSPHIYSKPRKPYWKGPVPFLRVTKSSETPAHMLT
eukprot:1136401-Pelagomonas_calceolata.AAC.1